MSRTALLLLLVCRTWAAEPEPHIKAAAAAFTDGQLAVRERHLDEAVDLFKKVIDVEPTFTDAYRALAHAYLDSGQRLKAGEMITRLLQIEPNDVRWRLTLGHVLLDEKQWNRALAQFTLCLRSEPVNADALYGFAVAAKQVGMADRATQALERGRRQYPADERFKTNGP